MEGASKSVKEEKSDSGTNSEEGVVVVFVVVESVEAKRRFEAKKDWEDKILAAPILLPDKNPTGEAR